MPEVITELCDHNDREHYGCDGGDIYFVYGHGDGDTGGGGMRKIEYYHQKHDYADDSGVSDRGREGDQAKCGSAYEGDDVTANYATGLGGMGFGHHKADKSCRGDRGYYYDFFDAEDKYDDADGQDGKETLESIMRPVLFEFV